MNQNELLAESRRPSPRPGGGTSRRLALRSLGEIVIVIGRAAEAHSASNSCGRVSGQDGVDFAYMASTRHVLVSDRVKQLLERDPTPDVTFERVVVSATMSSDE